MFTSLYIGFALVLVVGVVFLVSCARRPSPVRSRTWPGPDDRRHEGVVNFGIVTPNFWRGSQPTAEGFRNLEKAGVKTIVNLRSDHDDLEQLSDTNMKYIRIPMRAWNANQGNDAQLLLVMMTLRDLLKNPDCYPVFVHCAAGRDRTGYTVAAYRQVFEDWKPDDAVAEMIDFRFNTLWFKNPGYLRKLDVPKMHALLKRAP